MNKLPNDKRKEIIQMLVDGNSLRSASRIADVSINTVAKLLVDIGKACQQFHNNAVIGLQSERVQCDEIWSFVGYKENPNEVGSVGDGDVWTWTALDADSKLIISWLVGDRDAETATVFIQNIRDRLTKRVQLKIDGLRSYLQATTENFDYDVDYTMLIKMYGSRWGSDNERGCSLAQRTGVTKIGFLGNHSPKFVSTSYVERQNLTMSMHKGRFARLANTFSKKVENHSYAIALHFVYYNFCKIHKSLSVTPAMQAGLTKRVMTIEDIVNLAPIEVPPIRGVYKKQQTT